MRTDTGLKDSYNEPIYEGDAIYDEVGGFFNYIVKHNGRWYASHNPKGDVLNGSIEGGYGRQCQVIHTDAETVVELWQTHRKRDLKEGQLQDKIKTLELQLEGASDLIAGLQWDVSNLEAERRALLEACQAVASWAEFVTKEEAAIMDPDHPLTNPTNLQSGILLSKAVELAKAAIAKATGAE